MWHAFTGRYDSGGAAAVCVPLLCRESDIESSRRIKTEFLVQLDGAGTKASDLVLVVGRCWEEGYRGDCWRERPTLAICVDGVPPCQVLPIDRRSWTKPRDGGS